MAEKATKRVRILHPFRSYQGGEEIERRADIADRYVAEGHAEYVGPASGQKKDSKR